MQWVIIIPQNGMTALMMASFQCRQEIVQALVEAGAALDIQAEVCILKPIMHSDFILHFMDRSTSLLQAPARITEKHHNFILA